VDGSFYCITHHRLLLGGSSRRSDAATITATTDIPKVDVPPKSVTPDHATAAKSAAAPAKATAAASALAGGASAPALGTSASTSSSLGLASYSSSSSSLAEPEQIRPRSVSVVQSRAALGLQRPPSSSSLVSSTAAAFGYATPCSEARLLAPVPAVANNHRVLVALARRASGGSAKIDASKAADASSRPGLGSRPGTRSPASSSPFGAAKKSGKQALLEWCKIATAGYPGVKVENFTSSWCSGLAFCAIIHRYRPNSIDYDAMLDATPAERTAKAFAVAGALGILQLLDVSDIVNFAEPDELSVMTYLSENYHFFKGEFGSLGYTGKRTG